ncbi:MAG: hypothetical protein WAQ93_02705, partial [Chitinophagaceae bacterium]
MVNQGHYYSGKIGLDYAATKKTTLGIVLNGFYNPSFWESKTKTFINEPDGQLRSQTNTLTSQKEKWTNFSSNFNLR